MSSPPLPSSIKIYIEEKRNAVTETELNVSIVSYGGSEVEVK